MRQTLSTASLVRPVIHNRENSRFDGTRLRNDSFMGISDLQALCDRYGVFLRREALQLGYTDRALAALRANGVVHRVRHGAYAMGKDWDSKSVGERYALLCRAAYRTANAEVVLSHVSSLALIDSSGWSLPMEEVHLTRMDGRVGRREAGVSQHRGVVLAEDVVYDGELARMSATRTVLEIASIVDFERALCVANTLLHSRATTVSALQARAVDMHMWPGTANHELLLRHANPLLESVLETRTWCALWRAGLPSPVPQWEVKDEFGNVIARLDFAFPELGVWLECDGMVKYVKFLRSGETSSDAVIREKRRERRVEELTGWVCVRIEWADLADPVRLIARIEDAFRLARIRQARMSA